MPPSAPVTTTVLPLAAAILGAEEKADIERTVSNTRKATPITEACAKYGMPAAKQQGLMATTAVTAVTALTKSNARMMPLQTALQPQRQRFVTSIPRNERLHANGTLGFTDRLVVAWYQIGCSQTLLD